MADYVIDSATLTGIADAIRAKTGKTDIVKPEDMATEISSITTGGGENKLAQIIDRSVTEITAEDLAGVTKIGANAFKSCTKLVRAELPYTVTIIGNGSFQDCTILENLPITNSVKEIGNNAFNNCQELTRIVIPDTVTSLNSSAFQYCIKADTVIIGSGVKRIEGYAFADCRVLKSVTIKAETPPTISSSSFRSVPDDCAFYVPPSSVDLYKAATNWSARADYIFPILDGAQKGDLIWSATATGGKISWDSSIFEFNKVYFVENSAFNVYNEYSEPYPRIGTIFTAIDGKEYEIADVYYGEVWLKTTDGSEVTENLVVNFYSSKE